MKIDRYGKAAILTQKQIHLLFEQGFQKPRDKALFGTCLYCGSRIKEACSLLLSDVYGVNGYRESIIIRSPNTKGNKGTREIPVNPNLLTYYQQYEFNPKRLYFFPGRHGLGFIHPTSADHILRVACQNLGLEGISTHSFRRTALTRMSDAGIPLRHIQEISGHHSLAALQLYLQVTEAQKLDAVSTLDF